MSVASKSASEECNDFYILLVTEDKLGVFRYALLKTGIFIRGHPLITSHVKGGGILNFMTSHFKNSIKAILHV